MKPVEVNGDDEYLVMERIRNTYNAKSVKEPPKRFCAGYKEDSASTKVCLLKSIY